MVQSISAVWGRFTLALMLASLATVVFRFLVVAVLVLGLGRVLTIDPTVVIPATIIVGVLVPLLPVAALAWIEPDPPTED